MFQEETHRLKIINAEIIFTEFRMLSSDTLRNSYDRNCQRDVYNAFTVVRCSFIGKIFQKKSQYTSITYQKNTQSFKNSASPKACTKSRWSVVIDLNRLQRSTNIKRYMSSGCSILEQIFAAGLV